MTEAEARDICLAEGDKLRAYSRDELAAADRWVAEYALTKLGQRLRLHTKSNIVREYVLMMARHTYGSAEAGQFLSDMKCYPDWMQHL